MAFRFITRVAAVFFALFILFASVFETSSIKYAFGARDNTDPHPSPQVHVSYDLPHPGSILPGNPLWPAKVLREKVNLGMKLDPLQRAQYELYLADKRLAAGWKLWQEDNSSEALATFDKSENYLLSSYETLLGGNTPDNPELLTQLVYSSLKHREVLEQVMSTCGDEARPSVSKMLGTSKIMYQKLSAQMENLHLNPPQNPF